MSIFNLDNNHVYVGNSDKALNWAGVKAVEEATDESLNKLVVQVREKIKIIFSLTT